MYYSSIDFYFYSKLNIYYYITKESMFFLEVKNHMNHNYEKKHVILLFIIIEYLILFEMKSYFSPPTNTEYLIP